MNLDGEAVWSPIKNIDLRYAVNTNWDLFEHTPSKTLYLRYNKSWMQAHRGDRAHGRQYRQAARQLLQAAANENWKDVKAAMPGKELTGQGDAQGVGEQEPAELIALEGDPDTSGSTARTALLWVNNTESRSVPDGH